MWHDDLRLEPRGVGREAAAACEDREAGQLREGVHHQAERRHGTVLSVDHCLHYNFWTITGHRGLRRADQAGQVPNTHSETGLDGLYKNYLFWNLKHIQLQGCYDILGC